MISKLLFAGERSLVYLKSHPQIIFALAWIVVIPLVFLYSGERFLEAGRANHDRLEKDKVGLLHDVVVSLARRTNFDQEVLQSEIDYLVSLNPDLTAFVIARNEGGVIVPLAALDRTIIGVPVADVTLFQSSSVRFDESIIFEFYQNEGRFWQAFRSMATPEGRIYYLFTEHSLWSIDNLLAKNETDAYWSLAFIYILVLGLAYWQIRNTNFAHLYDEAKKANATKDLFTNMIAHELRAPLTAIRGYGSMIVEKSEGGSEVRQYAERIKLASERLLTIVNDLLDVARIQSGKLAFTKVETDLAVVINSVIDELKVSAVEKKINLTSVGTDQSTLVMTDPKRLQQALTNLVSNSIKYTKEGSITVSVETTKTGAEIRIKDTGMGIAASDQKNLFAPFYRVDNQDVSQITGTGLGMWITRQLLELMGAKIEVESIKGVGTHIVVTIKRS